MTRNDAELLRAAAREPEAFREFYDRYAVWIRSWFVRHTGSETASLDLTAETFAQAWHASERFRDEAGGSGAPWLFGIARNLLRQYHKHNRVESAARERLRPPAPVSGCGGGGAGGGALGGGSLGPAPRAPLPGVPPRRAPRLWAGAPGPI